jgi:hypothetical protein
MQNFCNYTTKDMESSIEVCAFKCLSVEFFYVHVQGFLQMY